MFNPVTKVCDWPTIVISIRPMCADPGHVGNNPFFDSHNMILKHNKIVEKRSTTTPITTTTTTTTTTRRTPTTSSTTTTRGTTSTTRRPSTVAVKGFHLFKTTKVPKKSFPKNSKITFIKPVTITNALFKPYKPNNVKNSKKRKVKRKPMKLNEEKFDDQSGDDELKRGDKSVFGYNSFFDISSLKLFTNKNVTSLTP